MRANMVFKIIGAAVLGITVSGCSSIGVDKYLGNRITCTVAKDKAYVTSMWGIIGISSEIVAKDSKVICSKQNDEE
jgi:hypothetical protein